MEVPLEPGNQPNGSSLIELMLYLVLVTFHSLPGASSLVAFTCENPLALFLCGSFNGSTYRNYSDEIIGEVIISIIMKLSVPLKVSLR